jgi:hypothetical protein
VDVGARRVVGRAENEMCSYEKRTTTLSGSELSTTPPRATSASAADAASRAAAQRADDLAAEARRLVALRQGVVAVGVDDCHAVALDALELALDGVAVAGEAHGLGAGHRDRAARHGRAVRLVLAEDDVRAVGLVVDAAGAESCEIDVVSHGFLSAPLAPVADRAARTCRRATIIGKRPRAARAPLSPAAARRPPDPSPRRSPRRSGGRRRTGLWPGAPSRRASA